MISLLTLISQHTRVHIDLQTDERVMPQRPGNTVPRLEFHAVVTPARVPLVGDDYVRERVVFTGPLRCVGDDRCAV